MAQAPRPRLSFDPATIIRDVLAPQNSEVQRLDDAAGMVPLPPSKQPPVPPPAAPAARGPEGAASAPQQLPPVAGGEGEAPSRPQFDPQTEALIRRVEQQESGGIAPEGEGLAYDVQTQALLRQLGIEERRGPEAPIPPRREQPAGAWTEFSRGIVRGGAQILSTPLAANALLAAAFGAEDLSRGLIEGSLAVTQGAEAIAPADTSFEDVTDTASFVRWAAGTFGEQVPVMATVIVGGGVAGLLARGIAQNKISREAANEVVKRLALRSAQRKGATAGAVGTSAALETAGTAQEQQVATGELDPLVATTAGLAKGSLEAIVPLALSRKLGITLGEAGSLLNRVLAQVDSLARTRGGRAAAYALGGSVTEGATELAQESIDIVARNYVDEKYSFADPNVREAMKARLVEAMAAGALVGGGFSGIAGAVGRPSEREGPQANVPPGSQGQGAGGPAPAPAQFTKQLAAALPEDAESTASPIAAVTPGGTQIIEFRTPEDLSGDIVAGEGIDPDVFRFVQARHDRLTDENTTASVRDLGNPEDINIENPRVRLFDPQRGEEALGLAQQAATKALEDSPTAVAEAQDLYLQAVDAGFRLFPQEGQSFIAIGDSALEGAQVNAEGLRIDDFGQSGNVVTERELGLAEQAGEIPVFPGPRATSRDEGELFQVDIERLPRARVDTGSVGVKRAAFSPAVFEGEGNFELFQKEVEESPHMSFVEGTTEAQARQAFNLLKETDHYEPTSRERLRRLGFRRYNLADEAKYIIGGKVPRKALRRIPNLPAVHMRKMTERSKEVDLLILDHVEAFDGTYDLGEHKPGTTRLLMPKAMAQGLTTEEMEFGRQLVAFYDAMLKKFGMTDRKIILTFRGLGGPLDLDAATVGYNVGSHLEDFTLIAVNTKEAKDFRRRVYAAAHEFGHALSFHELGRLDAGLQERIYAAYNNHLLRTETKDATSFLLSAMSPDRAMYLRNFGEFSKIMQNTLAGTEGGTSQPTDGLGVRTFFDSIATEAQTDYFLRFDEWFAEQIARYFTTQARPISDIERFFSGLAQSLKAFYRSVAQTFGKDIADAEILFAPDQAIVDFIKALENRPASTYAAATVKANVESAEANAQIAGTGAGPNSAATYHGDILLSKMDIPKPLRERTRAFADRFNVIMKYGYNLQQVALLNPHIRPLQEYREILDQWWTEKMDWISRADHRVREWGSLGPEQSEALGKLLFDLDAMVYLTREEREGGVSRMPTDAELRALVSKYKLEQKTFDMYIAIRDDFNATLDAIEEAGIAELRRTMSEDNVALDVEIARLRKDMRALRERPYFPHSRFGDFAVVVTDSDGATAYMQQFETQLAAKRGAARIRGEFKESEGFSVRLDKIPESTRPLRGLPPAMLRLLRGKLALNAEQTQWLDNFIAEYSPARSFGKRMLRRKDIPGYSLDAMRSYGSYFFHAAGYLARLKYGSALEDSINALDAETTQLGRAGGLSGVADVRKRRQIAEFMRDHLSNIMDPKPDWAQLRTIPFLWYLTTVKAAVVNLTQVPLVTLPYLSARYGDATAANALRKAVTDFKNTWAKNRVEPSERFHEAVNEGIKQSFLDESMAKELANIAEGDNIQRILPGTKAGRFARSTTYYAGWMFQNAEKINRSISFRAGWDLAQNNRDMAYHRELREQNQLQYNELLAKGWSEVDATAFLAGRDAVRRTQFEYARHARPRFMRGRAGGTIFTFFMFLQQSLWFTFHSPGATRYLLMLMLMGGLMGLPGAEDLAAAAKFLARKVFGVDFDLEREAREQIIQLLGEDPAVSPDLFIHGISREGFGLPHVLDALGLPAPRFDMSGSVSMGNIIPGLHELLSNEDPNRALSEATTRAAGATIGLGINMYKALSDDQLPLDDPKRWERAMPLVVKGLMRANRYAEEGRERTRTGATVVEFDKTDPDHLADIVFQGLGFTPTRATRAWSLITAKREVEEYWMGRRQMLLQQFDQALSIERGPGREDVLKAIRKFNRETPFPSIRISGGDIAQSRRARMLARRKQEVGLPQARRATPIYREVDRLYPEVEDAPR